jgi:LysM repeat protein
MHRKLMMWLVVLVIDLMTPIISSASVMQGRQESLPPRVETVNTYTIKQGDTLWSLSRQLDIRVDELMSENKIKDPRELQIGQVLRYTTWSVQDAQKTTVKANNTIPLTQATSRSSNPLVSGPEIQATESLRLGRKRNKVLP